MRENLQDIFKVLSADENLLRLLYYLPVDANDDPLSPTKINILDMDEEDKWDIINDRIIPTEKSDDLLQEQICRLFVYPGRRPSDKQNYLVAKQQIIFEFYVPYSTEIIDQRREWIADTINELISNKFITGLNKMKYEDGGRVVAPKDFVGYFLLYSFGSGQ